MLTAHVGIKELKTKLSSYIAKVQKGERVIVTDHGQEVATIIPISNEMKAARNLVKSGRANWSGGKPSGIKRVRIKGQRLSDTILEERQ